MTTPDRRDEQILVLAPTGRDAALACTALGRAGLAAEACDDVAELCRRLGSGAGAALVTEEALPPPALRCLVDAMGGQPAWSDFPLVVLTGGGEATQAGVRALRALESLGNVTFLERPVRVMTLVSTLRAALGTRRRQYEVRDLLLRLEEAARLKDEFLATLSHELRTPLSAVLGWTHLLRGGSLDAAARERGLEVIERNARAQAQIISDILDVSRIITGKLRLEARPVDLGAVVEAAMDTVQPAAEAKGVRLLRVVDASAGAVLGDPGRLQQVFWNLLSNAIRFTPRDGEVEVRAGRVESHLEVRVRDTGQGISADFLPYVFERFRQRDSTTTRAHGGLGLGLAIVRHLTEAHGGTVRAESRGEGQGATFTVSLPLRAGFPRPDAAPGKARGAGAAVSGDLRSLDGLQLVVVDDEADARDYLSTVFTQCGAEVRAVASAAEALAVLQVGRTDALVSDIGMPDEDGYKLIRRLRSLPPERGGRVPAVAVTAYARAEDRERALAAGYQRHVSKPVTPGELTAAVAELVGRDRAP